MLLMALNEARLVDGNRTATLQRLELSQIDRQARQDHARYSSPEVAMEPEVWSAKSE